MNFDEDMVYTAMDADELHIGDTVYVADTPSDLYHRVALGVRTYLTKLTDIYQDDNLYRFVVNINGIEKVFALAYFVRRGDITTFDINRVHTSVNAEVLQPGDMVYVADTLKDLRDRVGNAQYLCEIDCILGEDALYRFRTKTGCFVLAYFVTR